MRNMVMAVREIESKYGPSVAADVKDIIAEIKAELTVTLDKTRQLLTQSLSSFRASEMMAAGDLQKTSYKALEDRLKASGKLVLLYNSSPSAVIFDLKRLEALEESIEAQFAVLDRLQFDEGEGVSPKEFWAAMDAARPRD